MSARRFCVSLTVAVVSSAAPLRAQPAPGPRGELELFAGALDRALARVSRPAATALLPPSGDGVRGYHLKGYGAVFVAPARALPPARTRGQQAEAARALDQAIRRMEEALKGVEDGPLRRRMETNLKALRDTEAELRAKAGPESALPELQDLADVDPVLDPQLAAHSEAMRRNAERTQDEVDRAFAQLERQVGMPAPSKAPADPEAPTAPQAPEPPQPLSPPQAPPWSFWFEREEVEARAPERVIRDVGEAVTQVLEAHGSRLVVLRPEESVVVAVDFVPRSGRLLIGLGPGAPRPRAERTLVVRVRKRELEARREGKLAAEELRRLIEYVEY
jgi:hypothetical protein